MNHIVNPEQPQGDDQRVHHRRSEDKRRSRWMKIWLLIVTLLWLGALVSVRHQIGVQNNDRTDGTRNRCDLIDHVIRAATGLGAPADSKALNQLRMDSADCRTLLHRLEDR